MKFAVYMARILLCKHYKFSDKNFYKNGDNEFSNGLLIGTACRLRAFLTFNLGTDRSEQQSETSAFLLKPAETSCR